MRGRRRNDSWWSETSARRRALPGRGHCGDGFFCHCRILPEVRRRRRGWKAYPRTRGRDKCRPLRRFGGEVTGVVCDLCDKKGIPCQWGKGVPSLLFFFSLLISLLQKTACVQA